MNVWVQGVLYGLVALAAAMVLADLVRDQQPGDALAGVLAALELGLVVQAVWGSVQLAGADRDVAALAFLSYLYGVLPVLPVGLLWALAERTRAGTAVLAVAVLTVAAMVARIQTIWAGPGA